MCGGSAPQAPVYDPAGVTAGSFDATLAAGESAQAGSQVNQIGPTGALTYYQSGVGPNGVPTYSAVQQLTPQQQQLLNEQQLGMGLAGGAGGNMLANSYNMYSSPTDLSADAGGLTQQLLGQETSYLQPYFNMQTQQTDTQLRNQGINPGSPAYNNAMMQLQNNQNNSVTGFLASAEPNAFQQTLQNYMTPLQIGTTLSSFNQPGNVNLPETGQAPNYQTPNVNQAVGTAESTMQSNAQLQEQQNMANLAGIASIGSALTKFLPTSDRRLKKELKKIGKLKNGLDWYSFKYLWSDEPQEGVMSDEVREVMPAAVIIDGAGYDRVSYDLVGN